MCNKTDCHELLFLFFFCKLEGFTIIPSLTVHKLEIETIMYIIFYFLFCNLVANLILLQTVLLRGTLNAVFIVTKMNGLR